MHYSYQRLLPCLMLIAAASLSVHAGDFTGEANFFFGGKFLNEQEWTISNQQGFPLYSLENQVEFGSELSWGDTGWPVHIATDLFWSREGSSGAVDDTVAWTAELDVGVRKIWELGRVRPYAGGGMGLMLGGIDLDCAYRPIPVDCVSTVDDKEATIGVWVNAGVFFRLAGKFNLGVSTRYSTGGDLDIFGVDRNPGGFQLGMLIGFGWPKYQ